MAETTSSRRSQVLGALAIGLSGVAVLLYLGLWQLQRLGWKQEILDRIETRIAADPVPLPEAPDPEADRYLAVTASGTVHGPVIRLLVSVKQVGAGCRIVMPFETAGRRVMLDRGFVRTEACKADFRGGPLQVTGNLAWPDEVDGYTPAPEADWQDGGLWFARDVPAMAAALGAEPVLIVARSDTGEGLMPLPVGITGIPNDHLQYAMTWFSLAAVWVGMTLLLLRRISRRTA